jgi:hypothetical protein
MRAGRFIGAVGVALAVGAAGVTWSCGRSGRGGGTRQDYKPQTRENIIVLLPNGNSCRAIKPDPVRGYRKDKIRWTVVDACGGVTEARIEFTADSPDENGKLHDSFNNGRAELFVKIKDNPPGTPDPDGVLKFPYRISIVRNGASQTLEDPDLEVDPWSF